jgi:hypothetical protein
MNLLVEFQQKHDPSPIIDPLPNTASMLLVCLLNDY